MLARVRRGGVTEPAVLNALAAVPREEFVAEGYEEVAYADRALPIGYRQTISQPLMVGIMVQALSLKPGDRALDVGTGSGYMAAVMAACGARVVGVERLAGLARAARSRFARLGIDVEVVVGDGSAGLPGHGPFDAIAVGAAAPQPPLALLESLTPGGRLVVPVRGGHDGRQHGERLLRYQRAVEGSAAKVDDICGCRFVRLVGAAGYAAEEG